MLHEYLFHDSLISFLVAVAIQVTLLLMLVIIGTAILRPKSAAVRHGIWLGTLLALVALPAMTFLMRQTRTEVIDLRSAAREFEGMARTTPNEPSAPRQLEASDVPPTIHSSPLPSTPTTLPPAPVVFVSSSADDVDLSEMLPVILFSVWVAGMILCALRLATGWIVAYRLKRYVDAVSDERVTRPFDSAVKLLGLRHSPPLLTSSRIATPLVVGVTRPAIVLPTGIGDELGAEEIQQVLIHELAHVVRRDNVVGLLQRLVAIVWWFHPLVHFANRQLSRAREEVCDNYSLLHGERNQYARTLLHVSQQCRKTSALASTVGLIHPQWKLEHRIAGLLDAGRNLMLTPGTRRSAALVALWCAGMFVLSGATVTAPTQEEVIEHLTKLGCEIYSSNGIRRENGTEVVRFPQNFSGTDEDLAYLKLIKGLRNVYFVGADLTTIALEDLPDLETIHFINSHYDKDQQRQVITPFHIREIRLKNLPNLKSAGQFTNNQLMTLESLELINVPGVTEIDLQSLRVSNDHINSLTGAPNLEKLRASRNFYPTDPTGRTQVSDEGVNNLATLTKLEELDLSGGHITDASMKVIGRFSSLRELGLSSTDITDAGLMHLKNLRDLTTLHIDGSATTDDGLKTIVANHPYLEFLKIGGTKITPAGLRHLQPLKRLKTVSLSTDQLNAESCSVLDSLSATWLEVTGHSQETGEISGLSNIQVLFLWGAQNVQFRNGCLPQLKTLICRATGEGTMHRLFDHFRHLTNLEHLEIDRGWHADGSFDEVGSVHVNDAMMEEMRHLIALKRFMIRDQHQLTGTGIANLVGLENLEELHLTNSSVTDNDAALFSQMLNLKHLNLYGSKITNQGLYHFQNMKHLRMLNLYKTSVDQDAAFRFQREFLPDTEIQAGY